MIALMYFRFIVDAFVFNCHLINLELYLLHVSFTVGSVLILIWFARIIDLNSTSCHGCLMMFV